VGGLEVAIEDGKLRILREGRAPKFVERIGQVTFSGRYAGEIGQPVLYVTERCVFRRTAVGMELAEVAPGVDLEKDILAHLGFTPIIDEPRPMDLRIFRDGPMRLDDTLLGLSLAERLSYDPDRNTLFLNFEGFAVRTVDDVDLVRREVERRCKSIGKKLHLVVNYDGFTLDPVVSDSYFSMIAYMEQRYYLTASRYTTSAFMRLKLGASLAERDLAPHIFETRAEAQAFVSAHGAT
jgi:propionate CoA-transferase